MLSKTCCQCRGGNGDKLPLSINAPKRSQNLHQMYSYNNNLSFPTLHDTQHSRNHKTKYSRPSR